MDKQSLKVGDKLRSDVLYDLYCQVTRVQAKLKEMGYGDVSRTSIGALENQLFHEYTINQEKELDAGYRDKHGWPIAQGGN